MAIDPSLPWLMALHIGTTSGPRISPTRTRSGVHPQRPPHQLGLGDRALALDVRLAGLHGDDVGMQGRVAVQAEFEGVLDGDQPLGRVDGRRESPQHGGLADGGAAGDQQVLPRPHQRPEHVGRGGCRPCPARRSCGRSTVR